MKPNREVLESQLSEVEMALLIGINLALDAAMLAGSDGKTTMQHLTQHKDNFGALNKPVAQHIFSVLEMLHKSRVAA